MTKFKVSVDDAEFQAACKAVSIAIMNLDATMKRMAENAVIEPVLEEEEEEGEKADGSAVDNGD